MCVDIYILFFPCLQMHDGVMYDDFIYSIDMCLDFFV
jgi:hypothetical protein